MERMRAASTRSPLVDLAGAAVPFAVLVLSGVAGIDFGHHWDERHLLTSVDRTIRTGTLLPRGYAYPSVTYWLTLAPLAPEYAGSLREPRGRASRELRRVVRSHAYHLRVRTTFLVVSALAVVWVHRLVLVWRRDAVEALVAASILATSWQVAYHLRWIAPDGLLMQFGALTTLLVAVALSRPDERRWLPLAAVASGVAAGSKYPGVLLLLPVALAAWSTGRRRRDHPRQIGGSLLFLGTLCVVTYLVTTPGTLLHPLDFWRDVTYEIRHYRSGHGGYTVVPGVTHLARVLRYFGGSLFSPFPAIASLVAALAVLGTVRLVRTSLCETVVLLLSFPVCYLACMSSQRVLIVRNYLVVAPFLAVLASVGAVALVRSLVRPGLRAVGALVLIAVLVVDAGWLFAAAATIRQRDGDRPATDLVRWLDAHPDLCPLSSPRVAEILAKLERSYACGGAGDLAVLFASEGPPRFTWPANDPRLTVTWFGPWEVDFNYYPTWAGRDRILVMRREKVAPLGLGWVP